jgi:hypothetical protein
MVPRKICFQIEVSARGIEFAHWLQAGPSLPPNKAYLDSSHKLILLDGDRAEGPTAVVSPASWVSARLRAMMEGRARGANR